METDREVHDMETEVRDICPYLALFLRYSEILVENFRF